MNSAVSTEKMSRLISSSQLEFDLVPDDLKCAKCGLVMRNACQVPCGCRYCRTCIDDLIDFEGYTCPGGSQECAKTALSTALPDYGANRSISRLTVKCPRFGCHRECLLADMDAHLRVCPRQRVDCPFRELGCLQGELTTAEMSWHLQQESRAHSEMLTRLVAGMGRDVELLKRELALKDEQMRHVENEIKAVKNENKFVKNENRSIKYVMKSINERNKAIRDEVQSVRDENYSMRGQIEALALDREALSSQVRHFSEQLDWERAERRDGDERDQAKLARLARVAESDPDERDVAMEGVHNDIESIKDDIDSMKWQLQTIRMPMLAGQVDASCDEWLLDGDLGSAQWGWGTAKTSRVFRGAALHYTYQLASENHISAGALWITVRVLPGARDDLLVWPFRGAVTLRLGPPDGGEACASASRHCRMQRPPEDDYSESDVFNFSHSALREAGLELERGVRVSCQIVPGDAQ